MMRINDRTPEKNQKSEKLRYSDYYKEKIKKQSEEPEKIQDVRSLMMHSPYIINENKDFPRKKLTKLIKISIILIPILIIIYLIYVNLLMSQEFDYFYDIGSEYDLKNPYLSPIERITDISQEDNNYRNLTSSLVYFKVLVPRNSKKIKIQIRFRDAFPERSSMSLGAKDQEVWHYYSKQIYNPSLSSLSRFKNLENVYLINPQLYLEPFDELKYERGVVVATDKYYKPATNIIPDYAKSQTIINSSLRGGHTFYIYTSRDLKMDVEKQDLNWYNGSDDLLIAIYNSDNKLIANTTIEDDGITIINKDSWKIQKGTLRAYNLPEGVYKLTFSDADALIRKITINTNKIVTDRLFLADNSLYNVKTKPTKIYTKLGKNRKIIFVTYHSEGIQKIKYNEETFHFDREDEPLYLDLSAGEYTITIPKNDLIISAPVYLAFSKENYFEPFKQKVIGINNELDFSKKNVDYVVTDYKHPEKDENWLIAETSFDIEKDKLFVKDNELSLVFNVPHLSNKNQPNYTIPIDWINITVYKPGFFDKTD